MRWLVRHRHGSVHQVNQPAKQPWEGITMSKIDELKSDIERLPGEEVSELFRWLSKKEWENWDKEIEADSEAGKLDFLVCEAHEGKSKGTLKEVVEASHHPSFLDFPCPPTGIRAANCPSKLRAPESEPCPPFPAFQENRETVVREGWNQLPCRRGGGRRGLHLGLGRSS